MSWRKHGIMSRVFYFVTMKNIQNESLILSYNLNACLLSRRKQSSPEKHCYSEISHYLVWLQFIRSFLLTTFGNYSSNWKKISLDNPSELCRDVWKKYRTNSNFASCILQISTKVENPVISFNRDDWKWQKMSLPICNFAPKILYSFSCIFTPVSKRWLIQCITHNI